MPLPPFSMRAFDSHFISNNPALASFVSGSISASASTIAFQPFDLLKTRLQNNGQVKGRMVNVLIGVVKSERVFGLWRGTVPSLARAVPGIGLHFATITYLQNLVCGDGNKPTAVEAAVIGASSRTFAGLVLLPITVIKTRFESGLFNYRGLYHALEDTYARHGLRGLYSGLTPTLLRDVPYSAIYYMFFTQLKCYHKCLQPQETFACGLLAGIAASLVTQPFDVVKTKMQIHSNTYSNVSRSVVLVFKSGGWYGFFIGMAPRIMRRSLMSAVSWTIFETTKKATSSTPS